MTRMLIVLDPSGKCEECHVFPRVATRMLSKSKNPEIVFRILQPSRDREQIAGIVSEVMLAYGEVTYPILCTEKGGKKTIESLGLNWRERLMRIFGLTEAEANGIEA